MSRVTESRREGRDGAVLELWLDRPEKRNAMNRDLWTGITAGFQALETVMDCVPFMRRANLWRLYHTCQAPNPIRQPTPKLWKAPKSPATVTDSPAVRGNPV